MFRGHGTSDFVEDMGTSWNFMELEVKESPQIPRRSNVFSPEAAMQTALTPVLTDVLPPQPHPLLGSENKPAVAIIKNSSAVYWQLNENNWIWWILTILSTKDASLTAGKNMRTATE